VTPTLFRLTVWIFVLIIIIRRFIEARTRFLRGLKPSLGYGWIVLLLTGAVFSAIQLEEWQFGLQNGGYWVRTGEQHLLARVGGPEAIVRDSADLLNKVARGEIHALDNKVSNEQLTGFPALAPWNFAHCVVELASPSAEFTLNDREILLVRIHNGEWLVERNYDGPLHWSAVVVPEVVPLRRGTADVFETEKKLRRHN
jgi:hypothetical protein